MIELGSEPAVIDVRTGERVEATAFQCTAELAECTCPEFCERDHDVD